MAYATGTRFAAAVCFLASLSLILAPVTLPLGFWLLRKAKKKEKAREKELEMLEQQTHYHDGGG